MPFKSSTLVVLPFVLRTNTERETKTISEPRMPLFSFLIEPMVDLEPGIGENHDMLASFNTELEENMRENLCKLFLHGICFSLWRQSPG